MRLQARDCRIGRGVIRGSLAAALVLGGSGCGERLAPPGPPPPSPQPIVIRNVQVLPLDAERVIDGQTIVIESGRILEIGSTASVAIPTGAAVVEGEGRYLVPGLGDMHVHTSREEEFLLYIANGVTTVRDMAGSPNRLEFRDRIESGVMLGPRYFVSSPQIDGSNPGGFQGSVTIDTPADADQLVRDQVAAGYDFLKVYSSLSGPVYEALIRAADGRGLEVVGHVPTAVPLDAALQVNHRSHEHLFGYVDAVESPMSPDLGTFTFRRIYGGIDIDASRLPEVAASVAGQRVWNSPTLLNHDKWVPAEMSNELLARDVMKYVHPDRRAGWEPASSPIQGLPEVLEDWTPERFQLGRSNLGMIVKALHDAGAGLILGTDAGSTHLVHGFAVHDELDRMIEAGLTRFEALRTATYAVGEYLGEAGRIGTIAEGAAADLVLVAENPLVDITTLRRPVGVMLRGRWFDRTALDSMLAQVETAFR